MNEETRMDKFSKNKAPRNDIVATASYYIGQNNRDEKFGPANEDGWCHYFVNSLLGKHGLRRPWEFGDEGGPNQMYDWAKENGALVDESHVKSGDLIIENKDQGEEEAHVAIVENIDLINGTVTTIDGNWDEEDDGNDQVVRRTFLLKNDDYSFIDGFISADALK